MSSFCVFGLNSFDNAAIDVLFVVEDDFDFDFDFGDSSAILEMCT